MEALQTGHVAYMEEKETVDSLYNEYILTSLRTCWGLNLKKLEDDFGTERMQYCLEQALPLVVTDDVMRITRKGLFTSDDVMSDLFWVD